MAMGQGKSSQPIYAFLTIVVFLATMVVLIVTDHANDSGLIIGLGVSTLPSLVAALAAEKTVRDIRNGVVADKAKEGASKAIEEKGVLTRNGPVVNAQLEALQTLLSSIHSNTAHTVEKVDHIADTVSEAVTPPDGTPQV